MASGQIAPLQSNTAPSLGRRAAFVLPFAVLVSVVALLWWRLQRHEKELTAARRDIASASAPHDSKPRIVYVRGPEPAAARVTEETVAPERADEAAAHSDTPSLADEPRTPEEGVALRKARFDHIQGIFASQLAHDYEPERARRLETTFAAVADRVRKEAPDLSLGKLECRGRMCAADVSFDDPERGSFLYMSVLAAFKEWDKGRPRPHLIVHDGDHPGQQKGRVFFEWMPPRDAPSDG